MAVLTDQDSGEILRILYQNGVGKEELKAQFATLPSKSQFKNAFQVIESLWSDNAATVKSDVETALGGSVTGALAKKIGRAYLEWKMGKGG